MQGPTLRAEALLPRVRRALDEASDPEGRWTQQQGHLCLLARLSCNLSIGTYTVWVILRLGLFMFMPSEAEQAHSSEVTLPDVTITVKT